MAHQSGKPSAPRTRRPRAELEDALRRRYKFLRRSATAYDEGDHDEAYPLSVELRALLHYQKIGQPLLQELGLIKRLQYVDSSGLRDQPPGGTRLWGGGLTVLQAAAVAPDGEPGAEVVPRCYGPVAPTQYGRRYTLWWKTDRVVTAESGKAQTRFFLVTQMANTEGAHSDARLDTEYRDLHAQPSTFSLVRPDGSTAEIPSDVARASVRQIAWEVMATLENECWELLGIPQPPGPRADGASDREYRSTPTKSRQQGSGAIIIGGMGTADELPPEAMRLQ